MTDDALREPAATVPADPDRRAAADGGPSDDETRKSAPGWVAPMIRRTLWWLLCLVVLATFAVWILRTLHSLLTMLLIAAFFAVAMEPAVLRLTARRGMSRSAATGLIFLTALGSVALFFVVLVPSIVKVGNVIAARLPVWLDQIESTFNITIGRPSTGATDANQLRAAVKEWLHTQDLLGLATSGLGLLFEGATIATFAFYFVVDAPRLRRLVLTMLPPTRQQVVGWAWDTAIQQTGAFFYSRLLLGLIYTVPFFLVMVILRMPVALSLVLSIFSAFFAEFIPLVGTYIGAAVPVLVTLGIKGLWQAAVLLGWVVVYQQIENFWLAPKISSKTMEVNGAIAFGAAIAGGAIGGPIGAFMALPVAALITSFFRTYARSYPLTYRSSYDQDPEPAVATRTPDLATG